MSIVIVVGGHMERIYTTEIGAHVGERVRLAGWLHTLRRLGGINFLVLRDVRGTAQIVVDTPEALAALDGLLPETVLAVEGDGRCRAAGAGRDRAARAGIRGALAGARGAARSAEQAGGQGQPARLPRPRRGRPAPPARSARCSGCRRASWPASARR